MENITIPLPVKIGDNLYNIDKNKINTYTVVDIKIEVSVSNYINEDRYIMRIILDRATRSNGDRYIYVSDIGETMFLSKTDLLKNIADQL